MTLRSFLWPFRSRKAQVAVAVLVVTVASRFGLNLSETEVLGLIGVGMSLILGIAHEDHATKTAGASPPADDTKIDSGPA